MLTFDDKGGGVKKTQKPAYVIHGCSLKKYFTLLAGSSRNGVYKSGSTMERSLISWPQTHPSYISPVQGQGRNFTKEQAITWLKYLPY